MSGNGAPPHLEALAEALPRPYWTDHADAPDAIGSLTSPVRCDLCVIGGGYTGLWSALLAAERDPARDVVLLEADVVGSGASGRNGGFCDASLTHGSANGAARFPAELADLEAMGLDNLDAIEAAVAHYGIDCDWERTGTLAVATTPHQAENLAATRRLLEDLAYEHEWLDGPEVRNRVHSPTYLAGLRVPDRSALLDPARLAWGLRRAVREAGVAVYERTPAVSVEPDGDGVVVRTPFASVRAHRVVLGTNAFAPLVRRINRYVVPVWDYVLATEPLDAARRASLGWEGREGLSDSGNQFHYYRLSAEDAVIWGGYDAIYYFGGGVDPSRQQRPESFARLSAHFFETFPQLDGIRFTHAWGGAIDTCTRFSVFFLRALGGRAAYAGGFTGLGVGATRFAAEVLLDLLDGRDTPRTRLELVRKRPIPWPPEPLRWTGIQLTRWALDREDRRGRRGLWLRTLDRVGLGFDS